MFLLPIGASVEVSPETVLATNGSSGHSVSCLAPSFTDHNYYWILVNAGNGELNTAIATESVLELPQVVFEDGGARYQCIVETQFGNISSDIVEVVGEKVTKIARSVYRILTLRKTIICFKMF